MGGSELDKSKASDDKVKWSEVDLEGFTAKRLSIGELSTYDQARLVVSSRLMKKSLAQTIQTALLTYLNRNTEEHYNRLVIEAKLNGLTPEEMFSKILKEDK